MRGSPFLGPALLAGLVALAAGPARAVPPDADEKALQEAFQPTLGPALLDFFRLRTVGHADPERLRRLVSRLGDAAEGDRAAAELVALGPVSVTPLRQVVKDPDEAAAAERARRCLEAIEGNGGQAVVAAAIRQVAHQRPPQAADVLLAYLPVADDVATVDEVLTALVSLARGDAGVQDVLLKNLAHDVPVRRAVAAEAVCRAGDAAQRLEVHQLLQDAKPSVRLRAALALNQEGDVEAVPALIRLLADLPATQGRRAEEALHFLAGETAPAVPLTDDASRATARNAWETWWRDAADPAQLDFFRKRTLAEADRGRIEALVRQLGDVNYPTREQATLKLIEFGPLAEAQLLEANKHPDIEVRRRAQRCLESLQRDPAMGLGAATARLVALRKPPGALEALLAYVPSADEGLLQEVYNALAALALRDGKPDPALLKALAGPEHPRRRAAALAALCQAGAKDQAGDRAALLRQLDPPGRLRVGLALASLADREAVPVLIDLIGEPSVSPAAEDALRTLTGDRAPAVDAGRSPSALQKARDAWAEWWRTQGPGVTLARLDARQRELGFVQVGLLDQGRVIELGRDGKPRWQLDNLQYPYDMQVLPGDRVLVAEMTGRRVTERTLKNEVVWEKQVNSPVGCQRLTNGNTVIVTRNQVLEVDREGKEVMTHTRPAFDLLAGYRTREGQYVCLTSRNTVITLDSAGKEIKSFNAGPASVGGMELRPNGRVLVAHYSQNKVVEYDRDGKVLWEAGVTLPSSATRLPNGRTLVASQSNQQLLELDRSGKVVNQVRVEGRPWRVRSR